uniref:Mitochondrial cardiolipin hydrolase n=1 Tax=Magallana gigas TaxID=29159 RepID=K1P9V8_MAGGI
MAVIGFASPSMRLINPIYFRSIAVRTDNSSFYMHHKFVIIDNTRLLNGSFNWTRQAITGNQENLLVTSDSQLVCLYKERFAKLWRQYKTKKDQ